MKVSWFRRRNSDVCSGKQRVNAAMWIATSALGILSPSLCVAQSTDAAKATYAVVSIKPYSPEGGVPRIMIGESPDGFSASGVTFRILMHQAFGVEDNQIVGGPSWIESDQFVVDAKMDTADAEALDKMTPQQAGETRQHMMQAMLADRFHLTLHRESRELPVLALVVAKNGPKLHEANPGDTYANGLKGPDGRPGAGLIRMGMGELTCQAVPVENLTRILSQRLGKHVLDKTGLTGRYDFTLKWTPDESDATMLRGPGSADAPAAGDASAPSLYTALQEQLGLKLESQKGPVDVLVIDRVEKPTAN